MNFMITGYQLAIFGYLLVILGLFWLVLKYLSKLRHFSLRTNFNKILAILGYLGFFFLQIEIGQLIEIFCLFWPFQLFWADLFDLKHNRPPMKLYTTLSLDQRYCVVFCIIAHY